MSYPKVDILYLSEKDMLDAGVNDVVKCTDTMEEVVKLLDDEITAWAVKTATLTAV